MLVEGEERVGNGIHAGRFIYYQNYFWTFFFRVWAWFRIASLRQSLFKELEMKYGDTIFAFRWR